MRAYPGNAIEAVCQIPTWAYPGTRKKLDADDTSLIKLCRKTRWIKDPKKVLMTAGLRYNLNVESTEYVHELTLAMWTVTIRVHSNMPRTGHLRR